MTDEPSWRDLCVHTYPSERTPRVDTVRNQLFGARELLAMVGAEVEDLHVLAYDRPTASREKVHGGQRDYALDTHGDPRARAALRELSLAAVHACEVVAQVAHDQLKILRSGERTNGTRRMVSSEELLQAIEAQGRRAARGEYTPVRREAQPDSDLVAGTVDRLTRERDQARTQADRLTARLDRATADLDRPEVRDLLRHLDKRPA